MKKHLFLLLVLTIATACKKKEANIEFAPKPPPAPAPPKKVQMQYDVVLNSINPVAIDDTAKTCYNFKMAGYTKWKTDSFDICYFVFKKISTDTYNWYSLSGPSHSFLRQKNSDIVYTKRNTTFYSPKSPTSFTKPMMDTIQYDATLPTMIRKRFNVAPDVVTSETASITIKDGRFALGQIIGFRTSNGKYGILIITSDGSKTSEYVKFNVKYQQ